MSEPTEKPQLTIYHFCIGNSSTGPIGLCAEIEATSPLEALEIFREELTELVRLESSNPAVKYINIYTAGENISVYDIDHAEPAGGNS